MNGSWNWTGWTIRYPIHVEPRPMVYLDSNINGAMAR